MSFDSDSVEVQQFLAWILENPAANNNSRIRSLNPGISDTQQVDIISGVQRTLEKVLDISLEGGGPTLIHRLRFCWLILRKADNCIRKNGKRLITDKKIPPYNMKSMFEGLLTSKELHECFLAQLCGMLSLDPDGGFVRYYYELLSGTKTKRLDLRLIDNSRNLLETNLRRVIWWIIRRNKYQYVEETDQGLQIHFTTLVDDVRKELQKRCHPEHLKQFTNLSEEIENQVNRWLCYSCLEGEFSPSNKDEIREVTKYFIKDNDLKHKIKEIIVTSVKGLATQKKLEEQEKEIFRYMEENGKLEEANTELRRQIEALNGEMKRIRELPNQLGNAMKEFHKLEEEITFLRTQLAKASPKEIEPVSQFSESVDSVVAGGLQEFFKSVDSKYSLDVLRSVQLREEHSITLKNFIDHLFYCLRKNGLAVYPNTDEFDLNYNQSGLYRSIDFEVPPGEEVHVKVEKKGWALVRGGRVFPIRKAILKRA